MMRGFISKKKPKTLKKDLKVEENLNKRDSNEFKRDLKENFPFKSQDIEDISKLEEDCIESGAVDFINDDDVFVVYSEKEDYENVYNYLKDKDYKFVSSEIEMVPNNFVTLNDEQSEKVNTLIEILEDDEDVQNVWHNLK